MRKSRGTAAVEFALLFPLLSLLFFLTFDFFLLALRQLRLDHEAAVVARELAIRCEGDAGVLEAAGQQFLFRRLQIPPQIQVKLHALPLTSSGRAFQALTYARIVEVKLSEDWKSIPLVAESREVCRAAG